MADKYSSNGGFFGGKGDKVGDLEDLSNEAEGNATNEKAREALKELLAEKLTIDQAKNPNALRLLEQEIKTVQQLGRTPLRDSRYVNLYRQKPIKVTVKVLVPVKEHPKFNFVGKLLGPKGNSMKRLQEETMCKMSILGRGSMRDRQKEEELRQSLDPKYSHLTEDLHVEISALGPPAEAHARIAFALAEVRKFLIPDNNDNIRQEQLRELETYEEIPMEEMPRRPLPGSMPRGGGGPPMRGRPDMRPAQRGPPVSTPRVMPAKTKIMSILDRARLAMEDNYGGEYEEEYEPAPPVYEPYGGGGGGGRPPYHQGGGARDFNEYEPNEYFGRGGGGGGGNSYDQSPRNWKTSSYKPQTSAMPRHPDPARYRSTPYGRPQKH